MKLKLNLKFSFKLILKFKWNMKVKFTFELKIVNKNRLALIGHHTEVVETLLCYSKYISGLIA